MGKSWIIVTIVGILMIAIACDDPSPVGIDFVGEEPLSVTYFDTVSIKLATIKFDSIVTSSSERLLIGQGSDDYLGAVTAKTFFQVGLDSLTSYPDDEKAVYDSIALQLVFDGYSYYDTTQTQKFYLYFLINEMELNDDGYLYNTSDFKYGIDSVYYLGEINFAPRVNRGKPEYLHINNDFGEALFNLLRNKDDIVTDGSEFSEYIRGFALVPDTTNSCIIGLEPETNIRLYYTQDGEQVEQPFPIDDNLHFSQLSAENTAFAMTELAKLRDKLSSEDTGDMAFIQAGVGLGVRIEFPYLDYVRELSENNIVTDAELILSPVRDSYSGYLPLSTDLTAYKVDKYNNILGEVAISTQIYYDVEYNEETYYLININSFLEDQLNLLEDDGSALLLTLPQSDYAGTVNRIYIGNEQHEDRSFMRLLIMNINDTF